MKEEIEKAVREKRIVAIVRGFAPDICLKLAEAYAKGGIGLVEVTFNQRAPETWKDTATAIRAIRERFAGTVRVGAGTVLTEEQLSMCIDAGGEYMITPNVNVSLIRSCVAKGLVAMPGAMTPSEAVDAWEAGASFVKIFPAGSLGPGYVKAAGCVGAGVGGNLTNKEWIASGAWDKVAEVARLLSTRAVML